MYALWCLFNVVVFDGIGGVCVFYSSEPICCNLCLMSWLDMKCSAWLWHRVMHCVMVFTCFGFGG